MGVNECRYVMMYAHGWIVCMDMGTTQNKTKWGENEWAEHELQCNVTYKRTESVLTGVTNLTINHTLR